MKLKYTQYCHARQMYKFRLLIVTATLHLQVERVMVDLITFVAEPLQTQARGGE